MLFVQHADANCLTRFDRHAFYSLPVSYKMTPASLTYFHLILDSWSSAPPNAPWNPCLSTFAKSLSSDGLPSGIRCDRVGLPSILTSLKYLIGGRVLWLWDLWPKIGIKVGKQAAQMTTFASLLIWWEAISINLETGWKLIILANLQIPNQKGHIDPYWIS